MKGHVLVRTNGGSDLYFNEVILISSLLGVVILWEVFVAVLIGGRELGPGGLTGVAGLVYW